MEVVVGDMNTPVENVSSAPLCGGVHAVERAEEEDVRALVVGKADEATKGPVYQVVMNTGRTYSHPAMGFEDFPGFG